MIIDSKTPDGKEKLEQLLIDAVMNSEPEMLNDNYKVNEKALDNYMLALQVIAELRRKGKCSFTYDLWYKPYELHCIYIKWNCDVDQDDTGLIDLDAKEISDLIGKFDTIQLDKEEPYTWQLSSEIYFDEVEE